MPHLVDYIVRSLARGTRVWGPRWNARPLRTLYRPGPDRAIEDVVDWQGTKLKLSTGSALEWNLYFYSWRWYEPQIRSIIQRSLHPGDDAIDVGANIGLHAISMARACNPGRVLACEANPVVVPRLESNITLNWLKNVAVVPKAISSKAGLLTLHVPNDAVGLQAWASLRDSRDQYLNDSHTISVSGSTLDELVAEWNLNSVRLIKIDTEGFEPEVLYGGREVIAEHHPVLLFEYTRPWWAENGHTLREVLSSLESQGYKAFYEIARDTLGPIDFDAEVADIMAQV